MTGTLGYPRFGAAGGDIGSDVVTRLALQHPESLLGIHLTDVRDPWLGPEAAPLSAGEEAYRAAQDQWYELYFDRVNHIQCLGPGDRVRVPAAVALFPADAPANPPREWAERAYSVQRWTSMPRGGHFAAAEEPALLADDLRAFFGPRHHWF
jgi:pimeloyl-ACP methyl ester carboxylesterase